MACDSFLQFRILPLTPAFKVEFARHAKMPHSSYAGTIIQGHTTFCF